MIEQALVAVVGMRNATDGERKRAVAQARLPVRMGGLGLTSMVQIQPAARIGTWALVWRRLQQLCPREFGEVDMVTARLESFRELKRARDGLVEKHRRLVELYKGWDAVYYDIDKEGEGHSCFHPARLPELHQLLPLSEFNGTSDYLQHAQRTWSAIVHHHEWQLFLQRVQHVSVREAVRFMAVSQPYAGAWLNAVPSHRPFAIHSWAMRILVQRRLGLPLTAVAAAGAVSRHGREFDVLGDLATNDGKAGHQTRHYTVLRELVQRLRSVWGSAVEYEPPDYKDYSDHRPDVAIHAAAGLVLGDVKVFDDVGSEPSAVGMRGGYVAMHGERAATGA
jgi:hypothetical protein